MRRQSLGGANERTQSTGSNDTVPSFHGWIGVFPHRRSVRLLAKPRHEREGVYADADDLGLAVRSPYCKAGPHVARARARAFEARSCHAIILRSDARGGVRKRSQGRYRSESTGSVGFALAVLHPRDEKLPPLILEGVLGLTA